MDDGSLPAGTGSLIHAAAARRLVFRACLVSICGVAAGQNSYIDPTRPTVAQGATIQRPGVLQVEAGYIGYFRSYDQTQNLDLYYAATRWLRLDASVPGWRSTGGSTAAVGLGNAGFGAKAILFPQGKSRIVPGFALQYEETLPSAPNSALRSHYHSGSLITSQKFGKWTAQLDGLLIADCQHPSGCGLRGEGVVGTAYQLTDKTSLSANVFGDTVSVDAPPGAYALLGAIYKLRYDFAFTGGIRVGLSESAPRIGLTAGIVFGIGPKPRRHSP